MRERVERCRQVPTVGNIRNRECLGSSRRVRCHPSRSFVNLISLHSFIFHSLPLLSSTAVPLYEDMLSRDKRPAVPALGPRPNAPNQQQGFDPAHSHPAFLPTRVHVTAAMSTVPPTVIPNPASAPREHWSDASKVSPAWEGWARGPAEASKPRL